MSKYTLRKEEDAKARLTGQALFEEYERVFGEPPPMICMDAPIKQMREALRTGKKFNPMPGEGDLPADAWI